MNQTVKKSPKVNKSLEQSKSQSTMVPANQHPGLRSRDTFFDNLKGWMRPQDVAETFGISVLTIYSWKAKQKTRRVPEGLFIKFNRQLYVRTDILRSWISSQNDELEL